MSTYATGMIAIVSCGFGGHAAPDARDQAELLLAMLRDRVYRSGALPPASDEDVLADFRSYQGKLGQKPLRNVSWQATVGKDMQSGRLVERPGGALVHVLADLGDGRGREELAYTWIDTERIRDRFELYSYVNVESLNYKLALSVENKLHDVAKACYTFFERHGTWPNDYNSPKFRQFLQMPDKSNITKRFHIEVRPAGASGKYLLRVATVGESPVAYEYEIQKGYMPPEYGKRVSG